MKKLRKFQANCFQNVLKKVYFTVNCKKFCNKKRVRKVFSYSFWKCFWFYALQIITTHMIAPINPNIEIKLYSMLLNSNPPACSYAVYIAPNDSRL